MGKVDRRQGALVEGNGDGLGCRYRQHGNEHWRHRHARAARPAGSALAGMMLRSRVMIGLHTWSGMLLMGTNG